MRGEAAGRFPGIAYPHPPRGEPEPALLRRPRVRAAVASQRDDTARGDIDDRRLLDRRVVLADSAGEPLSVAPGPVMGAGPEPR